MAEPIITKKIKPQSGPRSGQRTTKGPFINRIILNLIVLKQWNNIILFMEGLFFYLNRRNTSGLH